MGMTIGTNDATTVSIPSRKNGTVTGMISYSRPTKKSKTKKKRLAYSFKKISTQIMTAKTSRNASKAARDARTTMVMLLLKQRSGDYDEKEVKLAIEHAKEMERVAKKKRKHMEQEERAKKSGSCFAQEDAEVSEEKKAKEEQIEQEQEQQQAEASAEELEELAREFKQLAEEASQNMRELAQELTDISYEDMDKEELEALKRKHRAEELHDLLEADMKYLKALFDKLAKEKQQSANVSVDYGSDGNDSSASAVSGVSLELAGVDMPVEVSEVPVTVEGTSVDVVV